MGYALCFSNCFSCNRVFGFNPMRVPSINVNGQRHPVCRDCIARANPIRVANGLDPVVPAANAYDACEEGELS
jgi:hypothetical protein